MRPFLAVTFLSALAACPRAQAEPQFTNLSDGKFERQIPAPDSSPLLPSTPHMQEALDAYAKLPFAIGERIRFEVTYLKMPGATAESMVRTPVKWKDKWAHRITGEVISADWFSWLLRMHDAMEALMVGSDGAFEPARFYINQLENDFKQTKLLEFDTAKGKISQRTLRKGKAEKLDSYELSKATKDAVGALYYFRNLMAKVGATGGGKVEFPVFTSDKTWTAEAKLVGQETIKVFGNTFETDVYKLKTSLGGILQQKRDRDIKLWLTRDERRLPVFCEANVEFGYIELNLTEWDPGFPDSKKKRFDPIRPK